MDSSPGESSLPTPQSVSLLQAALMGQPIRIALVPHPGQSRREGPDLFVIPAQVDELEAELVLTEAHLAVLRRELLIQQHPEEGDW